MATDEPTNDDTEQHAPRVASTKAPQPRRRHRAQASRPLARINLLVDARIKATLAALAISQGLSQRELIERLVREAQRAATHPPRVRPPCRHPDRCELTKDVEDYIAEQTAASAAQEPRPRRQRVRQPAGLAQ